MWCSLEEDKSLWLAYKSYLFVNYAPANLKKKKIHSTVDGYLDSFQFSANAASAAMNIWVYVFR